MLSNFSALLLGLDGFLRASHKYAHTHTHPGTLVYHWQVKKYNWIGASRKKKCGWVWRTEDQKPASFYQGCLETFPLSPITYLAMINWTLVHSGLICYSLSEYTQTPRLRSCFRLQPTQKNFCRQTLHSRHSWEETQWESSYTTTPNKRMLIIK